jgi:hypothetical protein
MMQSTEEHQEIPKGEAAVMPVGEPRWHRKSVVRKIGTQENCGPRKKFAAAGIRATRFANWHGARDAVMKGRRSNGNDGRLRRG